MTQAQTPVKGTITYYTTSKECVPGGGTPYHNISFTVGECVAVSDEINFGGIAYWKMESCDSEKYLWKSYSDIHCVVENGHLDYSSDYECLQVGTVPQSMRVTCPTGNAEPPSKIQQGTVTLYRNTGGCNTDGEIVNSITMTKRVCTPYILDGSVQYIKLSWCSSQSMVFKLFMDRKCEVEIFSPTPKVLTEGIGCETVPLTTANSQSFTCEEVDKSHAGSDPTPGPETPDQLPVPSTLPDIPIEGSLKVFPGRWTGPTLQSACDGSAARNLSFIVGQCQWYGKAGNDDVYFTVGSCSFFAGWSLTLYSDPYCTTVLSGASGPVNTCYRSGYTPFIVECGKNSTVDTDSQQPVSSPAGSLIGYSFDDGTCAADDTKQLYRVDFALNQCRRVQYQAAEKIKQYAYIKVSSCSSTSFNATSYYDPACTIPEDTSNSTYWMQQRAVGSNYLPSCAPLTRDLVVAQSVFCNIPDVPTIIPGSTGPSGDVGPSADIALTYKVVMGAVYQTQFGRNITRDISNAVTVTASRFSVLSMSTTLTTTIVTVRISANTTITELTAESIHEQLTAQLKDSNSALRRSPTGQLLVVDLGTETPTSSNSDSGVSSTVIIAIVATAGAVVVLVAAIYFYYRLRRHDKVVEESTIRHEIESSDSHRRTAWNIQSGRHAVEDRGNLLNSRSSFMEPEFAADVVEGLS